MVDLSGSLLSRSASGERWWQAVDDAPFGSCCSGMDGDDASSIGWLGCRLRGAARQSSRSVDVSWHVGARVVRAFAEQDPSGGEVDATWSFGELLSGRGNAGACRAFTAFVWFVLGYEGLHGFGLVRYLGTGGFRDGVVAVVAGIVGQCIEPLAHGLVEFVRGHGPPTMIVRGLG